MRSWVTNTTAALLLGILLAGVLTGCHNSASSAAPAATGSNPAGTPGAGSSGSALTNPNAVENQGGVDKQFMPGGGPSGAGGK